MKELKVLIIGAVALGPKVACRLKRLIPSAEVIMIDQSEYIAYGGCGIPYYVSGDISSAEELMKTSFHMLRDAEFFFNAKGVKVMTQTRAKKIEPESKRVIIEDLKRGKESVLNYDKLVLATGSIPIVPDFKGAELEGVFYPTDLTSAIKIRDRISKGKVESALIIGGGAIGCEMAEALTDLWGIETILIEKESQLLPGFLDETFSRMLLKEMQQSGVIVKTDQTVKEIERHPKGERLKVITLSDEFEVDMVICATGVRPNSELAKDAGLLLTPKEGILVNERLQSSDPDIYAGGDCIECINLVSGRWQYFPQGSLANRQGRIIATNIAGGYARFKGIVGAFAIKIFGISVAKTGLTFKEAKDCSFDPIHALVVQSDKAHFYPSWELVYLDLIVDRKSRRLLGAQGICKNGDSLMARINPITALLYNGATLEDLSNFEMAYSPPFASAMDILNATSNTAENILDGLNMTIDPEEFERLFFKEQSQECICLDVRGPENAAPYVKRYGKRWINIPQEQLIRRIEEIPKGKMLLLMCNSGVRSYEALIQLKDLGFEDARNIQGGIAALKMADIIKNDS